MSTFHGLEMAKQALFAQQSALYTTGHNIANANTDGYTRQRVNFETASPFPAASRNRPELPGQMGTGVQIDVVQRLRDRFLDMQYRSEQSKSGYWDTQNQSLQRLESVLNEPSESGLKHTMNQFWQSLQDLSVNPENSGARSVVTGRGEAVTDTFRYLSNTIQSLRTDQDVQMDVTVKKTNSLLKQINDINEKIKTIEPHGYVANDLYDDRDRLIDELSEIVSIQVTHKSSGGGAPDTADGVVTIQLADQKGNPFNPPVTLVNGDQGEFNSIQYTSNEKGVTAIQVENHKPIEAHQFIQSVGSLAGHIETYGYEKDGTVYGSYPKIIEQLDELAAELASKFNQVHEEGYGLDGSEGLPFFVAGDGGGPITAENIQINQEILDNPDKIAASDTAPTTDDDGEIIATGNGLNAIQLSHVFDKPFGEDESINAFYESIIGDLGVAAQEAKRMAGNTEVLRNQVNNQRLSMSAVSLDEEMSNMIQFQHAYNAAARSMTAMDELLDKIINGMGIVGR